MLKQVNEWIIYCNNEFPIGVYNYSKYNTSVACEVEYK